MAGIVWLASYPKSGNTWLRVFLANLIADQDRPVPLAEVGRYASSEALAVRFKRHAPRGIDTMDNAAVMAVRARVQERIAQSRPGQVLMLTHNMLAGHDGAPLVSMKASTAAVYMVRNPLDVVSAFAAAFRQPVDWAIERMANRTTYLEADGDRIFEQVGDWTGHVESWTGAERRGLLVVRHEDMVADPAATFAAVAAHLAIARPRAALQRAVDFTVAERARSAAAAAEEAADQVPSASALFDEGPSAKWRELLSEAQIARIVARHRAQMDRFGYLPETA